ncbi:MAG TPA: hypothetical protein VMT30_05930 [Candidatus Saccharimonadia bacterium]|nr:hypothetical protein [Candidatus Saccharimonadia bacterium]
MTTEHSDSTTTGSEQAIDPELQRRIDEARAPWARLAGARGPGSKVEIAATERLSAAQSVIEELVAKLAAVGAQLKAVGRVSLQNGLLRESLNAEQLRAGGLSVLIEGFYLPLAVAGQIASRIGGNIRGFTYDIDARTIGFTVGDQLLVKCILPRSMFSDPRVKITDPAKSSTVGFAVDRQGLTGDQLDKIVFMFGPKVEPEQPGSHLDARGVYLSCTDPSCEQCSELRVIAGSLRQWASGVVGEEPSSTVTDLLGFNPSFGQ